MIPSPTAISLARATAPASPTRTTWWGQLSIARNSSPPADPAIRSAPAASHPSASSTAFGTSWRWAASA